MDRPLRLISADTIVGTPIDALAPGKYKVQAWNENGGDPMTSEIEIKEGANEKTLELKAAPAGLSPDKFGNARQ